MASHPERPDLSGADLSEADLRGANVTGANLSEARYDLFTRWPYGFDAVAAGAVLMDN